MISDRGAQFDNAFWDELCLRLKTKATLSTAYHPETDGQTERTNGVVEQYLRAFCAYLQDDWAIWAPSAEFAINNHISESTRCTPFFANSGQHPNLGFEPARDLNNLDLSAREHMLRTHVNSYADKMDSIDQELRSQMRWAQATYEHYANQHREHGPRYSVGDKV